MMLGHLWIPWLGLAISYLVMPVISYYEPLLQSIDITVGPGQMQLQSVQITLPAIAEPVTVTHISMQTATVTIIVPGTCAATTPILQSTLPAVVTAGAQIEPDTKPGASFQLSPASTATVSAISSNLTPIAGNDTSPPSPGSCDCQCFCPLSAFPMLNGLPTVRSMPIVQNSTFLKLASPVTLDQMRSSTVYSKGISAVTIALQETGTTPSSPIVVSAMPAVSVVTTSLAGNSQTFDSATTPTSASTPQPNADNSPIFNIDTYSLFKSVAVPVVARDLETPVAKLAGG